MTKVICDQYEIETKIIPIIDNGVDQLNEAIKLLDTMRIPNFSQKAKIIETKNNLVNIKSNITYINSYLKKGIYQLNKKIEETNQELTNLKLIEIKPRTEKI